MARITDDEIRILNRKITKIYEELWEETGNELFRISYEKTMRCGEVVKGRDGKGKHYNCHDPFCLRCNRRKKNENRKKTEYVLQNAKKKGMKYIHIILTKSNKEINELNVTEKAEEMKNEVFEFVKEMKKIDKRINIIASEEIEVKSGKFNPHWHLVMQINKRLPQKTIKKTWDKISDGGISVFGKNKIEDEWQEKTMSYYISKEKTDFKKDLNKDDLKLKIETLTEFYKGKKAKNGKWTGRQTLFFKGERFEKAIKDYNNPMTEETENDEMKQQMEQMKKQMEQMAEELKRMKQEREQERQAKAEAEARAEQEAEALKQELEELKRSKKETETKAEAKAKAEKGERQEQGFLIIKDDDGNKVEVIEYKMRKGGGYCYISKDRTKAFTNSCYCTKYDNKGAFNIHEITEVMQSEGFERFSEQFGLEKIE
ncbi:hypothetical protein [Leptotrichia hongkongensis]|jgi:hypothetical protein